MPTVSVIIVNHNGASLLEDCLTALTEQSYKDFEVILVDNGSKDDSVPIARERMQGIRVICLPANAGFAKANNLGIEAALGRYVVLLNNDTKADRNFLEELVRAAEQDERIGMVAPKILSFHDGHTIDSVGGLLLTRDGIGQGRGRGEADRGQYDRAEEMLIPSACAALYRKSMLAEIGLFDDGFFAYCEDVDLGLRGVWAGWKTVSAPMALVFHKYSATTGSYSPLKLFLVERNHYFVVLKNYPWIMLISLPLWTLGRFGCMAYAVLRGRGKGKASGGGEAGALVRAVVRGQWEALRNALSQWRRRATSRRLSAGEFGQRLGRYRLTIPKLILTE